MFSGIDSERFGCLTPSEERLLDNVKKAFFESDRLYTEGRPEDCLAPICIAIDAAKTLRRSLRGEDTPHTENAKRFKEFIELEVPAPPLGMQVALVDPRSGKTRNYSFADVVYAIRCMVHENENLNAAEGIDYHILLDWSQAPPWAPAMGVISDGRITLSGHWLWGRLREVMAKFVTGIDMQVGFARGASSGGATICPTLKSIRPTTHRDS
jgi:hypothetical protein